MKKKRNIIKRNSGFLVGCVLAAGASFFTADMLMSDMVSVISPTIKSTEGTTEGKVEQTVAPESEEKKVFETDPFTVTASGNIIKGVETEKQTEKETEKETEESETDENGQVVGTGETDEAGNPVSSEESGNGNSSEDTGSSGEGAYDGGSYDDGSYSDGSDYYEQPIEIYNPDNIQYTDGSGGSGGGSDYSGGGDGSGGSGGSDGGSGGSDNGYTTPSDVILWGISDRYIDESELYNYSAGQLRLIRNEIFALHGRIFNSQDLMDYFSQKSWYVPMYNPEDFDANMFYYLNDYEEANLQVILNYEAALAGN